MDSLIKVNESASNVESESSKFAVSGQVFTVSDMVAAYTSMDSASYRELVEFVRAHQSLQAKSLSVQCGALRIGSSAVSSASDKSGSVRASSSTGGRNAKLESMKRARTWRDRLVSRGMCYAGMLTDSSASSCMLSLGEWPTVASLLQTPASSFRPIDEILSFRVKGDSSSVHVVDATVSGGLPLLPAMARVAQGLKTPPGSFGAVLRASGVRYDSSSFKLTARTAVGGEVNGDLLDPVVAVADTDLYWFRALPKYTDRDWYHSALIRDVESTGAVVDFVHGGVTSPCIAVVSGTDRQITSAFDLCCDGGEFGVLVSAGLSKYSTARFDVSPVGSHRDEVWASCKFQCPSYADALPVLETVGGSFGFDACFDGSGMRCVFTAESKDVVRRLTSAFERVFGKPRYLFAHY